MKRNPIILLVTAILLLQPFVILASLPTMAHLEPVDTMAVAQEPGSRLEPGEYTNHVPIFINGTDDFTSQGWPGSGTSGDPYVIEGLYIEYATSDPLIEIIETDAYFVIRDCYINQEDTSVGVVFTNTSHGTIEYSDITCDGNTVFLHDANDTVVSHSYVYSTWGIALYIRTSLRSVVQWNHLETGDSFAMYLEFSHYTDSSNNMFYADDSCNAAVVLESANYTISAHDSVVSEVVGFWAWFSINISIDDLTVTAADYAIFLDVCHGAVVSNSAAVSTGSNAVHVSDSNSIVLQDSRISSPASNGVYLVNSNDAGIFRNDISDIGGTGVSVTDSYHPMIHDCAISDVNTNAIYAVGSVMAEVYDNTIQDVNQYGVCIYTNSHNASIDGNVFREVRNYVMYIYGNHNASITSNNVQDSVISVLGESAHNGEIRHNTFIGPDSWVAIGFYSGDNWTIADNYLEEHWKSVAHFGPSTNLKILRNDIQSNLGYPDSRFIQVTSGTDCEIGDNTMDSANAEGIYLQNTPGALVEGNSISDVNSGIVLLGNSGNDVVISGNTVTAVEEYGVVFSGGSDFILEDNSISSDEYGVFFSGNLNGGITGNALTDCGFFFESDPVMAYYNHSFSGNTVNGLPLYYAFNASLLDIDGSSYGQIILANCSDSEITGGSFDRSTAAIQLFHCDEIEVSGISVSNQVVGVNGYMSSNVTVFDADISGGQSPIIVEYCDEFTFENSSVYSTGEVECLDSEEVRIANVDFTDMSSSAIYLYYCDDAFVGGNTIINATNYGIYLSNSHSAWIQYNYIIWVQDGIYSFNSDNGNAFANHFQDSSSGVFLSSSDFWWIFNNTLAWNNYGVYLAGCTTTEVFYNEFIDNIVNNGYDTGGTGSIWDDTVDTGNWWSDYTGSPPYPVPGSTGAVDNFPMGYVVTEPIINTPIDLYYAEFSTGNEITWHPFDDNLRNWEVEIDGSFWDADAWNFVDVTVNVDGLNYGSHTAHITVWDLDGNFVEDWVIINVYDDIAPTISHPSDMVIFQYAPGTSVTWQVFDLHPGYHELFLDGDLWVSGDWPAGTYTVGLDGLDEGIHTLSLVIYDLDGNSAGDSVTITVLVDNDDPTIDSPDDIEFIYGSSGHTVVWRPSDVNPSHYEISENDTVYLSGVWGGGMVVLGLDDLIPGRYNFTLTVYDAAGNFASDEVYVEVIPQSGWPPDQPLLDPAVLLVIAVIGGAIIAVAVILFLRKRKAGAGGE